MALFPSTIGGAFAGGWLARRMNDTTKHPVAQVAIFVLALMMAKDAAF